MKKAIFGLLMLATMSASAKTLVVYYSYTNNVEKIVNTLKTKIECDVIEIEPAEKNLDYAANNYAIGSAQIAAIKANPAQASSYPAIDAVNVDLDQYDTIIIGAPLWWSQMAAPLQTFLFQNGARLAGKNIGLIVSSHSSGTSGVEADAKRLIPAGHFLQPTLWVRSAQTSTCTTLLDQWLNDIKYSDLQTGISAIETDASATEVYTLNGMRLSADMALLSPGIYILRQNGQTTKVRL